MNLLLLQTVCVWVSMSDARRQFIVYLETDCFKIHYLGLRVGLLVGLRVVGLAVAIVGLRVVGLALVGLDEGTLVGWAVDDLTK